MVRPWFVTLGLMIGLARPAAAADVDDTPCNAEQPEAGAPVRAPLGPSDFGMVPEACPRYELSLRGDMGVLIDEPGFYGSLDLGATLRGRVPLPGNGWISASLPGFAYTFVANATVEADSADLSASTLGLHVPVPVAERLAIAPYVRWMLPTETIFENATRFGFEQGIAFVANLHPIFELTGGYAIPLLLTSTGLGTHSVFMPTVALDAGLRPWRWLEAMAGAAVRVVPGDDDDAFESLDVRAALRFYPHEGLLIDLGGAFPLLGRDRTNAALGLGVGWIAPE